MRIENHRLCDPPDGIEIEHITVRKGSPIVPRLIVAHYAVTHSLEATVAAQRARGYWAHLSIDGYRDGERSVCRIVQQLPFNERGAHAGKSSWRGRKGCNAFSVGIEVANPGPLIRGKDGLLRTTYGKLWPEDDAIEARHAGGLAPKSWTHWARYSDEEIDLFVHIAELLRQTYPTIVDVAGHDQIAPGRKFDPGPAWPMKFVRETVFGKSK